MEIILFRITTAIEIKSRTQVPPKSRFSRRCIKITANPAPPIDLRLFHPPRSLQCFPRAQQNSTKIN